MSDLWTETNAHDAEIAALRAENEWLREALKRVDLLIWDGFPDGAHVEICAALSGEIRAEVSESPESPANVR